MYRTSVIPDTFILKKISMKIKDEKQKKTLVTEHQLEKQIVS